MYTDASSCGFLAIIRHVGLYDRCDGKEHLFMADNHESCLVWLKALQVRYVLFRFLDCTLWSKAAAGGVAVVFLGSTGYWLIVFQRDSSSSSVLISDHIRCLSLLCWVHFDYLFPLSETHTCSDCFTFKMYFFKSRM